MRKIAISDIHGCALSFEALLDQVALSTDDELYLLGDYLDRGPDSKRVLDRIFQMQQEGYKVGCLRGNHEQGLLRAANDWDFCFDWIRDWGGRQTLESFNANVPNDIPPRYSDFMANLEYCFEVDGFILVHAGLDFSDDHPLQPSESMLNIRNWYDQIDYDWLDGRIVVHGHTPVSMETIGRMHRQLDRAQVIDIDGGCFAKHLPGKGWLCAFDLTNRQLFFQKNIDDVSGYWASR